MKPWIIYTRVSTDEQAREGASLDMQRKQCEAMAAACGHAVKEVISDEGISAKDLDRPGMQRIIESIDADKIGGVIVWKLDRWTRSLRDLCGLIDRLEAHKVALVSLHEKIDTAGPMGRFTLHLLGALAQLEREQIAMRVGEAKQHLIGQGYYTGHRLLPGMTLTQVPGERHKRYAIDAGPAAVVRDAFQRAASGSTLRQIKDHLAANGVERQDVSAVASLLRSRRYVTVGIVDEVTFGQAQEQLASRSPERRRQQIVASHRTEREWILRGLARCGHCGGLLVGSTAKGRGGKSYSYLRCTNENGGGTCTSKPLPADTWEAAVVSAVVKAVQSGMLLDAWKDQARRLQAQVGPMAERRGELEKQAAGLRASMANLLDVAQGGGPAAKAVFGRMGVIQGQLDTIDGELATIAGHMAASDIAAVNAEGAAMVLAEGIAVLPSKPPAEQTAVLRRLVQQVVLHDGEDAHMDIELAGPSGFAQKVKWRERMGVEPTWEIAPPPRL